MFLNSSGIISILNRLDFKKLVNFLSRKSIQTFFSRVGSQLVTSLIILFCWVHVFEHVHPFASLLVKSQTKFTIKSRNKQNNKDIEMAGNDWKKEWIVDSSSMMQHGKETEMQKCIIVWSRWTFAASNWRKILVSIKRYFSPGGYLEAPVIIPWFITWSYLFSLESFLAQGSYYQISKKEVKSL
jgi:hypothetical protein